MKNAVSPTGPSRNVRIYELDFLEKRRPVNIRVEVAQSTESPLPGMSPTFVSVIVDYTNLRIMPPDVMRTHVAGYYLDVVERLTLKVTGFILPPELTQCGIGTFIWSSIYKGLAPSIAGRLRLRGELSAKDATVSHVDASGHLVKGIPNIERRNNFWKRMLDANDHTFKFDKEGNGKFEGRFVDPATNPSYSHAFNVIEKFDTEAVQRLKHENRSWAP
jgi:hypothetical protein